MRVELTMADVAVCALLSLTAGPAAVLTIKSWISTMSPAKVTLSSLVHILKWKVICFATSTCSLSFVNLVISLGEPPPVFLELIRQKLTQAPLRLSCFGA